MMFASDSQLSCLLRSDDDDKQHSFIPEIHSFKESVQKLLEECAEAD